MLEKAERLLDSSIEPEFGVSMEVMDILIG